MGVPVQPLRDEQFLGAAATAIIACHAPLNTYQGRVSLSMTDTRSMQCSHFTYRFELWVTQGVRVTPRHFSAGSRQQLPYGLPPAVAPQPVRICMQSQAASECRMRTLVGGNIRGHANPARFRPLCKRCATGACIKTMPCVATSRRDGTYNMHTPTTTPLVAVVRVHDEFQTTDLGPKCRRTVRKLRSSLRDWHRKMWQSCKVPHLPRNFCRQGVVRSAVWVGTGTMPVS